MFKEYRNNRHYNEPSRGGFWLLLIGGTVVGAAVPIMLGLDFPRGAGVGAIVGIIIWLICAVR